MNAREAKEVLLLYRPESAADGDTEMAEALEIVRTDPELRRWFEEHCAFQNGIRKSLRQIQPPPELREAILAQATILRPPAWWRQPSWMALAASLVVLGALSAILLRPHVPDTFANFRARMVSSALRQYRMDVLTHDQREVRQYMQRRGAPADYSIPKPLERLQLTGGGLLLWRSNPVAMVCFDRGDKQMLFLFVMRRSAARNAPGTEPDTLHVRGLATVSWTSGDNSYVLAGPDEPDFEQKYTGS